MEIESVENVIKRLRYDIITEKYTPEESLTEMKLAKDYDCTRTSIRSAMAIMEGEGLLKIGGNGRKKVLGIGEKDIRNIYALRNYIEQTAVSQFMQNPNREYAVIMEPLKRITDHTDKTFDEMLKTDSRFHRAVIEASCNRILLQTWDNIYGIINAMFQINMESSAEYRQWFLNTFCDRHITLFSALLKDVPTAQKEYAKHIGEAEETSVGAINQLKRKLGK